MKHPMEDTIRVNNVDIDKYEVYEYLYYILERAGKKLDEMTAHNIEFFEDTIDFIKMIIGEENYEEFVTFITQFYIANRPLERR